MNNTNNNDLNEDCNEPILCSFCGRIAEWPKCMKNTKTRGYHSVYKMDNCDDVVKCGYYEPMEFDDGL